MLILLGSKFYWGPVVDVMRNGLIVFRSDGIRNISPETSREDASWRLDVDRRQY
jgi:hypothetical protein